MTNIGFLLRITVLVVTGIASLVYWHYHDELDRAREAANRGGLIAHTSAGPIEYAMRGAGIPLLSIHGAGGGYDQGLTNAADLVGDSFQIIAPSRFGYLRTSIPRDAFPAAQADAHAALLAELSVPKAIVLGVSAGARSAVELAIRHPNRVAALILMVPGTYSPTSPVSVEESRGSEFAFWLVNNGADFAWWATEKVAPSVLIRFIGVPPELVAASAKPDQERVMNMVRSIQPLSLRFPGINVDSTPELSQPPLETITVPTLIISARDDLFNTLPAAEFAASRIWTLTDRFDTGGHLLVGHNPEVREAARTFLNRAGCGLGVRDFAAVTLRRISPSFHNVSFCKSGTRRAGFNQLRRVI